MLQRLRTLNANLQIKEVTSPEFQNYGRILNDVLFSPLIEGLRGKEIPSEGNRYVADDLTLHFANLSETISQKYYAEMPIQIGYCNGHTHVLNAFEYHQGNEINYMATDCILMLARQQDITELQISSSKAELFYFPAGTVIELYGTTLHFAPCAITPAGFQVGVILPKGTNAPLSAPAKSPLIWGRNKWLIAHPDSPSAKNGAYVGITGSNITVVINE